MERDAKPPFTMRLLGTFHVTCAGQALPALRSQMGKWLLALLALHHDREVQRAWVANILWPNSKNPLGSLNTCLSDLRNALGAEQARIISTPRTLYLDLTDADVDVIEFEKAIKQGDSLALQRAIDLYTGPVLADWSEPWVMPEREERANVYVTALENLGMQALTDGDRVYALECLRKAVAVERIQERMHRLLMQTLADAGDHLGAMQVYRELTDRLAREGLGPAEAATTSLYQHIWQIARKRVAAPPPIANPIADAPQTNVLRPLTELLGRDLELQTIIARLPSAHLITLTGPGGVGKTRLATEAALKIAPNFAHGAQMVTLETLTDPELIAQQIARTLGVEGQSGRPWHEALVHFLRSRQMLLVLDNCEHLIAACADLARKLVGACPNLHLLVTSRERLGLTGEIVRHIPPLALPKDDLPMDPQQCLGYSAVRLFCERAADVRSDFELSEANVGDVITICRRLDGLPLAIELAAALVENLPVQELVRHLDHRFDLLQRGDPTTSPRHQALKAVLDWSYDLLKPEEQNLLCRLCVFSGGWTLEAAEALPFTQPGKRPQTLMLLSRLVSKSLVLTEANQGETRYGMLETIREYGREMLTDKAVWESTRQAHCKYYASLAETNASGLLGASQVDCLARLEREHANLRAALLWATGDTGDPRLALRLGAALWRFWHARGYHVEGQNWLQRILQLSHGQPAELRLNVWLGSGNLYYVRHENEAARPCFEQCLMLAQDLKNQRAEASALASLANIAVYEKRYVPAKSLFEAALQRFEALPDARGTALTLSNLAMLACRSDRDYTAARGLHMRSLALFQDLEALYDIAHECTNLAYTLIQLREFETAYVYLDESLALSSTLKNPFLLAHSLTNYIGIATFTGQMERAAVLMGADAALRARIDFPLPAEAASEKHHDEQILHAHFGAAAFNTHFLRGQIMTEDEMRAYAADHCE